MRGFGIGHPSSSRTSNYFCCTLPLWEGRPRLYCTDLGGENGMGDPPAQVAQAPSMDMRVGEPGCGRASPMDVEAEGSA